MIGIQTNQATTNHTASDLPAEEANTSSNNTIALSQFKTQNNSAAKHLAKHFIIHSPKAGLNPLVDAASYLFTLIGELKQQTNDYRQLSQLQKELIQEIKHFQDAINHHGYNAEYILISRYILCATLDDIIANTSWGGQGQWDSYSLLLAFNQDAQHQDKFFTILERALKEPPLYIDLMELIYICLSMGYKGQYRSTEHSQYQLEQITNNLYKHIRSHRGSFSKTLSPVPLKTPKLTLKASLQSSTSILFIFMITACVVMTIFIGLDYLMDVISNEAYKNISQIKTAVSKETIRK